MTTLYASTTDVVSVGLQANVLARALPSQVTACLIEASDEADGYMRGRWGMSAVPLLVWDNSIRGNVARMAAFKIVNVISINPDSDDYKRADKMRAMAEDFFDEVQRQQRHPLVTLASGQPPGQQQPGISTVSVVNLATGGTQANRGW